MVTPTPGFIEGLVAAKREEREELDRARGIDCTPTWLGLLPLLLTIYVDGSDAGRKQMLEEMQRMAEAADRWSKHCNYSVARERKGGRNG